MADVMSISPATGDMPLYLTMDRYTRGSSALFDLRAKSFREEVAAAGEAETRTPASATAQATDSPAQEDDGFGFDDLLDIVNPLQHLPVIGTLYRELTGDELSATSRIAGGALYGGALGAGLSVAEAAFEEISGDDFGGHIAGFFGFGDEPEPDMQLAETSVTTGQAAAAPEPTPELNSTPASEVVIPNEVPNAEPLPQLSEAAFDLLLQSIGGNAGRPATAASPLANADFVSLMTEGLDQADQATPDSAL